MTTIKMQEIINFEIGDKSYNLVGYNKDLIEEATRIVQKKFNDISAASQSATTMESKFLLVALNIAEELILERSKSPDFNKNNEYNQLLKEMEDQLYDVLETEKIE
ncbi:cell division protein ZapA [bacterium]|jgi:hypothetical protein|nr:cell division protein ZapA [bacterium]